MATDTQTDNDLYQEVASITPHWEKLLETGQLEQLKHEYGKIRDKITSQPAFGDRTKNLLDFYDGLLKEFFPENTPNSIPRLRH